MMFTSKYNTLQVTGTTAIRIPMVKRGVVDHAVGADWTPAAGDVKVTLDAGSPANITNLPTAVAMGNGAVWEFILTAAELTCKQLVVEIADSATKAVEDSGFVVRTFGNSSAYFQSDLQAATGDANVISINSISTSGVTTVGAYQGTTQPLNFTGSAGSALVKVDTIDFSGQAITAAGAVTIPGTIASPTNITAGTITTVTNLTNAATAGDLTSTMKASAAVAVLTTQMTEAYAALGAAPTLAQCLFMIQQALTMFVITGTSVSIKGVDGSTQKAVLTLDSATVPTQALRTT